MKAYIRAEIYRMGRELRTARDLVIKCRDNKENKD
jgi:hypothetical protein